MTVEERLFRLGHRWDLSIEDKKRMEELVRWRVQTSTMSYDDCLSTFEWSTDIQSLMSFLEKAKAKS